MATYLIFISYIFLLINREEHFLEIQIIVQQPTRVCMDNKISAHVLLEEQFRVTFLRLQTTMQCPMIAELAFRTSLPVAMKYSMMRLQLKYAVAFA